MKDIQYFIDLLAKEKGEIIEQLKTLGRQNPDDKNDWQTLKPESDDVADDLDVAEGIQQYESDNAVLETLETRLHEVEHALSKIESGNYGNCDVCGNKIEDDRLEANPSATTCISHMQ